MFNTTTLPPSSHRHRDQVAAVAVVGRTGVRFELFSFGCVHRAACCFFAPLSNTHTHAHSVLIVVARVVVLQFVLLPATAQVCQKKGYT